MSGRVVCQPPAFVPSRGGSRRVPRSTTASQDRTRGCRVLLRGARRRLSPETGCTWSGPQPNAAFDATGYPSVRYWPTVGTHGMIELLYMTKATTHMSSIAVSVGRRSRPARRDARVDAGEQPRDPPERPRAVVREPRSEPSLGPSASFGLRPIATDSPARAVFRTALSRHRHCRTRRRLPAAIASRLPSTVYSISNRDIHGTVGERSRPASS